MISQPLGKLDRPLGQQHIPSSSRRLGAAIVLRLNQRQWIAYPGTPLYLGIPIDDYLSEVAQQLGRSILPGFELEEARGNVDHSGGRLAIDKILVIDDIFQKRNIGLHPPDSHFSQSSMHAIQCLGQIWSRSRYLYEKRVIKGSNNRTRIPHRPIQPYAKACSGTITENLSIVRGEALFRVFGGHTTLHGTPVSGNFILRGYSDFASMQTMVHRHKNLRTHDVNARDLLSYRMLHLNSWIHFNEEPFVGILIEKKLDGARIIIANLVRQFDPCSA